MLVQLVDCTLWSNNGGILSSDNYSTGRLSKVTNSKLKKLIQPVLIQFVGCTFLSDNGGTVSSDTCGTGRLSKVTSSKLLKLIQPVLTHLPCRTLHSGI